MTTRIKRTEAGSGGKKGHSNMAHWSPTAWVKDVSRKARRQVGKAIVKEQEND